MLELKYPLFDGEKLWDGACVGVEGGVITSVRACDPVQCGEGFLMPGLIDAHTHMGTATQVQAMLQHGITATCDVSASGELVEESKQLEIVSSAGMAMGMVRNPKGFVDRAVENGAQYIKALLFSPLSIGKGALSGIVKAAHEKGLKVAVHATEVTTVRQAVEANVDILLHVPMKEPLPEELAKTIAQKEIAVAPTLVMMETFANSGKNGYKPEHYQNAENAVGLLRKHGVATLCGTDANPGTFSPGVPYGSSLHREMELLEKAGLPPVEVLKAATIHNAEAFCIKAGKIVPRMPANMLLVHGRPDRYITDTTRIQQLWIHGKPIFKSNGTMSIAE